ncbi:MAG: rRNA-intervening sequence protein [Bacteroidota bacterium]|jgi:four helix bundle protein
MFNGKLEDWVLWQKAITLLGEFCRILETDEYVFFNYQIKDDSLSIINNLVEGFESKNNQDCISFLSQAKTISEGVISKIMLAKELSKITKDEATVLLYLIDELMVLITDTIEMISVKPLVVADMKGFSRN